MGKQQHQRVASDSDDPDSLPRSKYAGGLIHHADWVLTVPETNHRLTFPPTFRLPCPPWLTPNMTGGSPQMDGNNAPGPPLPESSSYQRGCLLLSCRSWRDFSRVSPSDTRSSFGRGRPLPVHRTLPVLPHYTPAFLIPLIADKQPALPEFKAIPAYCSCVCDEESPPKNILAIVRVSPPACPSHRFLVSR